MIVKKYILGNLSLLNKLYEKAVPNIQKTYYCKLAMIETCGWIELSMDEIVDAYAKKRLKLKPDGYSQLFKDIIKKNYGFKYASNFRKMLIPTIGLRSMESIETEVNKGYKIDTLKAELDALTTLRNDASHTYVNATKTYPSPSVMIGKVEIIHPILSDIDRLVRRL